MRFHITFTLFVLSHVLFGSFILASPLGDIVAALAKRMTAARASYSEYMAPSFARRSRHKKQPSHDSPNSGDHFTGVSDYDSVSNSTPYTHIVAFGDNLSDNGNGSYAHGRVCGWNPVTNVTTNVPGCSKTVYGYRTWTNGPVAVSYLATMLGVPLTVDYAFGHADGGSKFGATINNSYTKSLAGAPDAFQQVANYTSSPYVANISTALHFLWIGANDISFWHMNTAMPPNVGKNADFVYAISHQLPEVVQDLITAGATKIFVPNLYAKHISPSVRWYGSTPQERANLGNIIQAANVALQKRLQILQASVASYGVQIVYYDVFDFMMNLWNNHLEYGITHVGGEFCDGYSQEDWDLCVMQHHGNQFYWMQFLDMTTHVDYLIAQDMSRTIFEQFI